jgi:hypothetical protein
MSLREDISRYLVLALKEIEDPRINLVSRDPFEVDKLAISQFPALLVTFALETRETVSMGESAMGRRTGSIEYDIRGFVRGTELDTLRNTLIESVEEQLDKDRYLGLRASGVLDSQVTEIEVIPRLQPLAEVRIRLVVRYNYLRGNT